MSLLRVRSLSRSLTWLLAASVVAAGMLAVEPADAARKTGEIGQGGESSEGPGRIPHLCAVREGCGSVLAVGRRHAARADRQAKPRRADHARRLRADPAAALDRSPGASSAAAGGPRRSEAPAGVGRAEDGGRAARLRAAASGERSRIQARLCERGHRRGPDRAAGGPHLCVRDRRQRHLRRAGRADASEPQGARDLVGGRLQPVARPPTASDFSPRTATASWRSCRPRPRY